MVIIEARVGIVIGGVRIVLIAYVRVGVVPIIDVALRWIGKTIISQIIGSILLMVGSFLYKWLIQNIVRIRHAVINIRYIINLLTICWRKTNKMNQSLK